MPHLANPVTITYRITSPHLLKAQQNAWKQQNPRGKIVFWPRTHISIHHTLTSFADWRSHFRADLALVIVSRVVKVCRKIITDAYNIVITSNLGGNNEQCVFWIQAGDGLRKMSAIDVWHKVNIGSSFPIRLKSLSDHVRTLQDRSYKNWIQLACYTKSDPPIPIFTTSVILLPEYPVQLIWMNMYANVARTCTTHLSTLHYAQPNNEAKYIMPKHKYNNIILLITCVKDFICARTRLTSGITYGVIWMKSCQFHYTYM